MKPVAALGGALVVIVLATARVALAVECGDVITEDTVLLADVGPCTDQGVQVVGPATLDLNGHAIRGLGRGPDQAQRSRGKLRNRPERPGLRAGRLGLEAPTDRQPRRGQR